jgi:DMSO/TMAO reductase YedYZ molybdopterin-dependent catalytic subunit
LASRAVALLCLFVLGASVQAEEPAPRTIDVSGALPRSASLGQAELNALGATTGTWTLHGKKHQVTGVRLDKVLTHLGFTPGPMGKDVPVTEKRAGFRKVVVATARDGFQAVFSVAECFQGMGPGEVLVVWAMDGKPLATADGPFRLAVPTDAEPSRSLRQLRKLEVVDAVAR